MLFRIALGIVLLLEIACQRDPERMQPAPAKSQIKPPGKPLRDAAFWELWGDGKAELNGYDLIYPRYGQLRKGVAVAIFVTETFSNSARVKAEPGRHSATDQFPVMKLNLVKDFQTGIYDYNDMTSAFVALAPVNGRGIGMPTKISFSSQEWCGHVYMQALFQGRSAQITEHSYFDGEADQFRNVVIEGDTASEDTFMLAARGIAAPRISPGKSSTIRVLGSLESSRNKHMTPATRAVTVSRSGSAQSLTVPAGTFQAETFTARFPDGFSRTYYVESAAPRRVLKWTTSEGESARLLGSDRLKYWEMNKEGGEAALAKLGLRRRGPRMP